VPLANLAPNHGIWELRLGERAALDGVYHLEVYDKSAMTQSGPFPLRFPNGLYALQWFDSLVLAGSRTPVDDREALRDLVEGFIEARGSSEVWGLICNALFHSDHQGPFLESPWWYGSAPPVVDQHPLTSAVDPGAREFCQLFTDLTSAQVVGIRRQIGDDDFDDGEMALEWWVDGEFVDRMPPHLGHGRQFKISNFDLLYLDSLVSLLVKDLAFPDVAEWLLTTPPDREVHMGETSIGFREMLGRLINELNVDLSDLDADPVGVSSALWLSGKVGLPAMRLLDNLVSLLLAQASDRDRASGSRWQETDEEGESHRSSAVADEFEFEIDEFYELLYGPRADHLFAFHYVRAKRARGATNWQVREHAWRFDGQWDEDFPDSDGDWRWRAENERLAQIPDTVAEALRERGIDEEFVLAWDVSESIRIEGVYDHIVTDLFDRPIDIPVGIGEWAAIDHLLDLSIEEVEEMSASAAEAARNVARQSMQWATEDTPENGLRNLRQFVFEGTAMRASVVFRALIELLIWMHRSGVPGDAGRRSLDGMSVVPSDPSLFTGVERLVSFVAALVALTDDVVVINVAATDSHPEVYVQLCREDDGALTLEAVSNEFLDGTLTPDQVSTLLSMGWQEPIDSAMPNFHRFVSARETAPGEVADFLVRTLIQVYGTHPRDRHTFAPFHLTSSLLSGTFGAELAANPDMNPARRARLMYGIRFPDDLAPVPHSD